MKLPQVNVRAQLLNITPQATRPTATAAKSPPMDPPMASVTGDPPCNKTVAEVELEATDQEENACQYDTRIHLKELAEVEPDRMGNGGEQGQ